MDGPDGSRILALSKVLWQDAAYRVATRLQTAGRYTISAKRGSQDVLGSPLNITVLAGGIALTECAVYGTGASAAVAGIPADVFVQVEAQNVLLI